MSIDTILLLVAIVLTCMCAGLLVVRLSNPRLLGLGWLGGAFAAGGMGSILLFLNAHIPAVLSICLADLLVLLSFVLLNVAVQELMDARTMPVLGTILLAAQAVTDLTYIYGDVHSNLRIVVTGMMIAIQAGQTALLLTRSMKKGIRAPASFSAALLFGLMAFNLARSVAIVLGRLDAPELFERVKTLTFVVHLGFAVGIAFGFFWMTTSSLTASLDELASTDPLTRVYNRRVFLRWCERELARSRMSEKPFTLLMVDLDHFKTVNDRFGHATGDAVLCGTVERMQDAVRGIDVIGRWGGEEFVVLLPGASADAALMVAQRVRGNIEKMRFPVAKSLAGAVAETVRVTASVGVSTYQGPEDDVELMLMRADRALYEAKARGRNRVLAEDLDGLDLVPIPST
jgi:diguanylate cyclase (GGDEF)-like protein